MCFFCLVRVCDELLRHSSNESPYTSRLSVQIISSPRCFGHKRNATAAAAAAPVVTESASTILRHSAKMGIKPFLSSPFCADDCNCSAPAPVREFQLRAGERASVCRNSISRKTCVTTQQQQNISKNNEHPTDDRRATGIELCTRIYRFRFAFAFEDSLLPACRASACNRCRT